MKGEKNVKKRLSCICALMLALALLLSACGSPSAPSDSGGDVSDPSGDGPSKVINIALSENNLDLDPHNTTTLPGIATMYMEFDTLVESDHEGNYSPCLATEWEVSDDGLSWTFKLREGVTFHTGEEFDSADVVCTFQRHIDNPVLSNAASQWPYLESVEALGKYTVKITNSEPFGCTLMSCARTWIIPDEAFAEYGEELFTTPISCGTGPWILDEWVDGQYTHFYKNENYWGDFDSYYDEVYFRHILEPASAITAHINGDVQAYISTGGISNELLSMYDNASNIELVTVESGTYMYIGLQCGEDSVFHDQDVRKAFELAIDRQLCVDAVYGGMGKVPNGIIVDTCMGYNPDEPPYEYDPELAAEILAASSYDGREITLSTNTSTNKGEQLLLVISEMLNEVGFNSKVENVESATLLAMRTEGNYDAFLVANMHPDGDAYFTLNQRILNDIHHSDFVSEEMNNLILESNASTDNAYRAECFSQVNHLIREANGPHTAICQLDQIEAIDYGVTGLMLYSDGYFNYRWVTYDPSLVP